MSDSEQPRRIETFLYDADGNRTDEESIAVRGEVVELDADGRVIARHEHLDWEVDLVPQVKRDGSATFEVFKR